MGRFDALTQVEEKPQNLKPSKASQSPTVNNQQQPASKKQSEAEKKPAKPQTRLHATQSPLLDTLEKPEKYTTRLEPSLVKKIQYHAIEMDLKDYEVVKEALSLYFENKK